MDSHSSVIGALDAFWATLRRQAERDPTFAAELAKALNIPVELRVQTAADVDGALPFLDPVIVAGRGMDEFRRVFSALKDADLRRVFKIYNLAPPQMLTGKGAPKGTALVDMLWSAAQSQRKRLENNA